MSDETAPPPTPRWKRIVFKPSGEALAGEFGRGLDGPTLDQTAVEIIDIRQNLDVDVSVVVGGGNFWRGRTGAMEGMDATQSDHIGMLGTVMNALALQDALERHGQPTRVQSAIEMPRIAEPYIRRRAMRHLEKGRVVIFAAGTGNPFFTTDSAASLRAIEIGADIMLKATKVDGVYSADPVTNPDATLYQRISFDEALARKLGVMDATALVLCSEHNMPVRVFNIFASGHLGRIVAGQDVGTLVQQENQE